MRETRWVLAVAALVAALAAGGCASGSGGGSLAGPDIGDIPDAGPVSGNVRVTWKNLDPKNPDVIQSIVNASSDLGGRLSSGRATSTETRVLSDEGMGSLVKTLENLHFFEFATPGLGLDNVPDVAGRKGIVVVEQDGRSHGLMLTRNMGKTRIPRVYVDSKGLVLKWHGQLQGFEVRVNSDAGRVFRAQPIRPRRR